MNNLSEVESYLNSLINYEVTFPLGGSRDRPKLAPVYAAAERLALPLQLPKCAHIAGTVGKGSTAAFLQALLSARQHVLSFTSPHLISFTERVQLNGEDLPEALWCEGIKAIHESLSRDPELKLTYFETIFVFYLWASQRLGTTAHVVETGLGGSFDATNVLQDTGAVFTMIDFDHTEILGKTLRAIARDKSGIIKPRCRAYTVPQSTEALAELRTAAEAQAATLTIADLPQNVATSGRPAYQASNFAVALLAARALDPAITTLEAQHVWDTARIAARQEYVREHPNLMVDTCHNPASFRELAGALRGTSRFARTVALVAMMKDKDVRSSLSELRYAVDELWVTSAPTPRSMPVPDLQNVARKLGFAARVMERLDAYESLRMLPDDTRGVVCGSFYLTGDFLRWLRDA